ncbi:hypothetical protein Hanom_Chr07g00617121 [Helianthus anomalus]
MVVIFFRYINKLLYFVKNKGEIPHPPLLRGTGFESWEWHMSPRVRTRHGEVTAKLAWSGSGSRSEITPAVGRTVHLPPPPTNLF